MDGSITRKTLRSVLPLNFPIWRPIVALNTPQKYNITPENCRLEDYFSPKRARFQGLWLSVLGECTIIYKKTIVIFHSFMGCC